MVNEQMNDEQLVKEVKTLISKVIKLPEEKIDPNGNLFSDFGVDSLLGVEIFAALDRKFGISVPEEKLRNINTMNDIVALVKELKR